MQISPKGQQLTFERNIQIIARELVETTDYAVIETEFIHDAPDFCYQNTTVFLRNRYCVIERFAAHSDAFQNLAVKI